MSLVATGLGGQYSTEWCKLSGQGCCLWQLVIHGVRVGENPKNLDERKSCTITLEYSVVLYLLPELKSTDLRDQALTCLAGSVRD